MWLAGVLIGDLSYIKNCVFVGGTVLLRPSHHVTGAVFINGTKVDSTEYAGDKKGASDE